MTAESAARPRQELGLDDPLWLQYARYWRPGRIGLRPEGDEAVRSQARQLGEAYGIEHVLVTRHLPG